jgi:hypothetical protein
MISQSEAPPAHRIAQERRVRYRCLTLHVVTVEDIPLLQPGVEEAIRVDPDTFLVRF